MLGFWSWVEAGSTSIYGAKENALAGLTDGLVGLTGGLAGETLGFAAEAVELFLAIACIL
jgi:hypothetical protein